MRLRAATVLMASLFSFVAGGVALVATVQPQGPNTPDWHITATVAESCSCTVACPCNFGGSPNRMPCEGNRFIAITDGHYDDVDLAGVSFLVTFEMRQWSKIYVGDGISDRQQAALEAVLPLAFGGFRSTMQSLTKGRLTMEMSEDHVRFSGPESSVDMEVMRGFGDRPVKILNLPNPAYQDYTQYRSVSHSHQSADHHFSHSGTNGFTSTMRAGSR
ncbi:MAG: DUF1326 domain-containing protein [Vicinamibacterales bacterium]